MSNLLSTNCDVGLGHAIHMGYDVDVGVRLAFTEVRTCEEFTHFAIARWFRELGFLRCRFVHWAVFFLCPLDSVTLACDGQVMTKVLKQGAEFDALAETDHNLTDRYPASTLFLSFKYMNMLSPIQLLLSYSRSLPGLYFCLICLVRLHPDSPGTRS